MLHKKKSGSGTYQLELMACWFFAMGYAQVSNWMLKENEEKNGLKALQCEFDDGGMHCGWVPVYAG